MRKLITMRDALASAAYFGGEDMLGAESWCAWRIVLIAALGEALTAQERAIFRQLTGLDKEPGKPVRELWCVIGRRGGKSRAIAVLAAYMGACVDYRHILAPGQKGLVPVMAASREQAAEIYNYDVGIFQNSPALKEVLDGVTADTVALRSRVEIQIRTASYKRARGFTSVAAIGDECAFWAIENSTNPDLEIVRALRPSLMTTNGPLVMISSPYARRGQLYETWRRSYGNSDRPHILVVQAPSRVMNPSLPQEDIDTAFEEDPEAAAAEYGAQFRSDIAAFVDRAVIDAAVMLGVYELPPLAGVAYRGFCDPAGGSGQDAMTIAIGHREGDACYVDYLGVAQPPFSPESVCAEFAVACARYGVRSLRGDKWGGAFVVEGFQKHGIAYEPSAVPKSDIYKNVLSVLNSGRAKLLDNQKLIAQLCGLERRTARGGRDSIDHAPSQHDDLANAAAGVIVDLADLESDSFRNLINYLRAYGDPPTTAAEIDRLRNACTAIDAVTQ